MSLEKKRKSIDLIDQKIMALLEKRKQLAIELLPFKKNVLDKQRENEILAKAKTKYLIAIYKEILNSTKKEQEKLL